MFSVSAAHRHRPPGSRGSRGNILLYRYVGSDERSTFLSNFFPAPAPTPPLPRERFGVRSRVCGDRFGFKGWRLCESILYVWSDQMQKLQTGFQAHSGRNALNTETAIEELFGRFNGFKRSTYIKSTSSSNVPCLPVASLFRRVDLRHSRRGLSLVVFFSFAAIL